MMTEKEHLVHNSVTDIDNRGAYINPPYFMSLQGLPHNMSRVGNIILGLICEGLRYSYGQVMNGYGFISNVNPVTVDTILSNAKSKSYADGKKIEYDRRNYRSHIRAIHDNNIYYVWKCGKFYIFIMERELRSWLIYNDKGCVTPNSIIKIITRARGIINDMIKFHIKSGSYKKINEIESEFGFFINGLIHKMNPLVASQGLIMWDKKKHIHEYLGELLEKLEVMDKFEGLHVSDKYLLNLPEFTREYVIKKNGDCDMKIDLEKAIAPDGEDANMVVKKKKRKPRGASKVKKTKVSKGAPETERFNNESINPFDSGGSMTEYYRARIEQLSGRANIRFQDTVVDNRVGVEVLDLLKTYKLVNKAFLNDWIEYFYKNNLKGNKVLKAEYNAMSAFRYTFERFKDTYHIPQ